MAHHTTLPGNLQPSRNGRQGANQRYCNLMLSICSSSFKLALLGMRSLDNMQTLDKELASLKDDLERMSSDAPTRK